MDRVLDCHFLRRFGVEIELNTFDGIIKKLNEDNGEIPLGAEVVACMISKLLRKKVQIDGWHYTHNNDCWVVKPDSSCGIEVCTPVLKGWKGLRSLLRVIRALNQHEIRSDKRCSMHVHVNIADLNRDQLASVIAHYIKCEHVIYDCFPPFRKNNRYCQFIGMTDLFWDTFPMDPDEIINRVSGFKYYSINAYHFIKGGGFTMRNARKQTLEFRIAENDACLDPYFTKNWIRFILHFVEVTKDRPLPNEYKEGDPSTGLLLLDPKDVFKLLKFDEPLSGGLGQVKQWMLGRCLQHGWDADLPGVWSNKGRAMARSEFLDYLKSAMSEQEITDSREERLFAKNYIL